LDHAIALVHQLPPPGDASGAASVTGQFRHRREDVHNIAKEDRSFELPVLNAYQCQRCHHRSSAGEARHHAEPQQAMDDRLPKRRIAADQLVGVQRIMVPGQHRKVGDIVATDFAFVAGPAIAELEVFKV